MPSIQEKKLRKSISDKKYREQNKDKLLISKREEYIRNRVIYMLASARNRAKKKNLEFSLTKEDIVIPEFCPILGIPIIITAGRGLLPNSPSIDRIDNTKGYFVGNIIIVSNRANQLKNCSSFEDRERIFCFYKKLMMNQILNS